MLFLRIWIEFAKGIFLIGLIPKGYVSINSVFSKNECKNVYQYFEGNNLVHSIRGNYIPDINSNEIYKYLNLTESLCKHYSRLIVKAKIHRIKRQEWIEYGNIGKFIRNMSKNQKYFALALSECF